MIKPGDRIPFFTLNDQNGESFSIQDQIGKKILVIYFYPKDETAGCTAEACSFRDQYEEFSDLGAAVIGISADPPAAHRIFSDRHRLPFTLLSDPGDGVRKMFGVPPTFLGLIPGRVTYVVDLEGIVRHVFNSQFRVRKHVEEAMRSIRSMDH